MINYIAAAFASDEGAAHCVYKSAHWLTIILGMTNGFNASHETKDRVQQGALKYVVMNGVMALIIAPSLAYQGACLVSKKKDKPQSWSSKFGRWMIYAGTGVGLGATYYLANRAGRAIGDVGKPALGGGPSR